MAVVRCPGCRAELEVADRLMGEPVACGACDTVFDPVGRPPPARRVEPDDDFDAQPRRRRRDDDDDEYDDDRPRRPDAHPAHLPGLLSAVLCVLTLLLLIGEIVLIVAVPQAMQNNPFLMGQKPPPPEVLIGLRAFACAWLVVVLAASFRMMAGRNHGFAMAGMVMHLFPCTGICWPFGLAVAVWGLVVLHRPEVKAGFDRNDRPARAAEDEYR